MDPVLPPDEFVFPGMMRLATRPAAEVGNPPEPFVKDRISVVSLGEPLAL